jgi:hypothetical protein
VLPESRNEPERIPSGEQQIQWIGAESAVNQLRRFLEAPRKHAQKPAAAAPGTAAADN